MKMMRLEEDIPLILCKLERIFPPSFFDSMEHLPIHLAYEARIAGPVQYRWMYPFERYLRKLKNNVRNKAKVEGSICNAYLVEEASSFCSYYFEDHVHTKHRDVPRNYDGRADLLSKHDENNLSIFKHPGRAFGQAKMRCLSDKEIKAAHTYILLNCAEIQPYINVFVEQIKDGQLYISSIDIDAKLEAEFATWLDKYAHHPLNNTSDLIKDLAKGPLRYVTTYPGYYVNGYKFHTLSYGSVEETVNYGVCIKGSNYSTEESDFYGQLEEVVQFDYPGLPVKKVVLFKYQWFDPTSVGTRVHADYKLVDVDRSRRFNRYEPFILAIQASKVYYCSYPTRARNKSEWRAVCKIKARSNVEVQNCLGTVNNQLLQLYHFKKIWAHTFLFKWMKILVI